MVGENFEISWSQMARKALKLTTMFGENFEICWHQTTRNALKLSTIVGEIFEICWHQMARKTLKIVLHCNVHAIIINNNVITDRISQIHKITP